MADGTAATVVASFTATEAQHAKLRNLGGAAWLRRKIDTAGDPPALEPEPYQPDGTRLVTGTAKVTALQKERLAQLGGSRWVRHVIDIARVRSPVAKA